MATIAVVTVNWNTFTDTRDFLRSLNKIRLSHDFHLEKIVVDNGSTDNSVACLSQEFSDINLIRSPTNLGFSGGYNLGLKTALRQGAEYLFIINNDTLIKDPYILEKLMAIFEKNHKAGLITPKIYFAPDCEFHHERYADSEKGRVIWYAGGQIDWQNLLFSHRGVDEVDHGQYDQIEETQFCTGCAIFTSASVLEKIGLFDESLFAYLEDADLNLRARKAGYQSIYAGNTAIWHKTSRSVGGIGSPLQDYFSTRNRLIFGRRYASFRTQFALFREAIKLYFSGRPPQKLGVADYFLGHRASGRFFQTHIKSKI